MVKEYKFLQHVPGRRLKKYFIVLSVFCQFGGMFTQNSPPQKKEKKKEKTSLHFFTLQKFTDFLLSHVICMHFKPLLISCREPPSCIIFLELQVIIFIEQLNT